MFTGTYTAIATPFRNDVVDEEALAQLIASQIKGGVDGIVPVGTTGESPTVDFDEHHLLIKTAVEHGNRRVPIIAGTGANSTREAIELSAYAKQVGADMSLSVVPYYNKPTQEGLYRHFRAIAEAVDLPMVLYNVPGRTVADMQHDTVMRLAQVDGIIGIKEATGNIDRAQWLIKHAPEGFSIYSGDDPTAIALMLCGGHGNVSVTANVAPRLMHALCMAAIAGDSRAAIALHQQLMPLNHALFVEPNPIPVKWAAARMGLCGGTLRLPLTGLTPPTQSLVEAALRSSGILA
jgi:4-hydroxy-tetrahydrodipicolinate synthase